jgi:hypothetical protein
MVMESESGENVFDALLALGFTVAVADDGRITAQKGNARVAGTVEREGGAISWSAENKELTDLLFQARVHELKQRADRHDPLRGGMVVR